MEAVVTKADEVMIEMLVLTLVVEPSCWAPAETVGFTTV